MISGNASSTLLHIKTTNCTEKHDSIKKCPEIMFGPKIMSLAPKKSKKCPEKMKTKYFCPETCFGNKISQDKKCSNFFSGQIE